MKTTKHTTISTVNNPTTNTAFSKGEKTMKNTKFNAISTVNNSTTNTANTKGEKTMKTTRTKKHAFKARIIASVLSALTVFSAFGAGTASTVLAAENSGSIVSTITSTVTDFFKDKSLGFVQNTALKIIGPELSKAGLTPILNTFLGIEDEGPSNQDILDALEKSTAEIKAEIARVLEATKELSTQTANYHQLQMNQLRAINSNIDTKDFRTQADTVAADFAHALKRIDENRENITCDGSGKINNTTYKAYKEILADPKCNVSTMQANFDEMLRFLKGQRTSNNNENGYRQLTNYLMDRIVAADLNEHSYTNTPDYNGGIDAINTEIKIMEQQAVMDFAIINVLNSMQRKVKEYEIDNGIITVNEDESPYARYENTATNLQNSLVEMNKIFTEVLKENESLKDKYITAYLYVKENGNTVKKGCTSFIDAWSQGVDSGCSFTINVTKRGQELVADSKKGFQFDENVKGISEDGGFLVPEGKKVYIDMTGWSNGFYAEEKPDMHIFTVSSNSDFTIRHAKFKDGENHIFVPDNAKNARVTIYGCGIYSSKGPAVLISKKADNTSVKVQWSEYWDSANGFVKNNNKSSVVQEESCNRMYEEPKRGGEYWGT